MRRAAFIGCLLAAVLTGRGVAAPGAFTPADAAAAYETAAGLVRACTPRHGGTPESRRAADWLCARLVAAGVPARVDAFESRTPDGVRSFTNVVVEFPGTRPDAPWIVLMSHFDTAPLAGKGFQGANDGASTSGLLVSLANVLKRRGSRVHPLALVWTDGEECRVAYGPHDGFHGSRHLAAAFRQRKRAVAAAVCLDMLGDRDLDIMIPGNTTPFLKDAALRAAVRAGLAGKVFRNDAVFVQDDHSAFLDAGYPAIDLIDFNFGSAPGLNDYWHTAHDTLDKISQQSLHASGRLVCALLDVLEETSNTTHHQSEK